MKITLGFYREAWLVVARGGWWGIREILEQLPDGVEVDDAASRLWIMARRHGYLQRRGRGKAAQYAVTNNCETPHGIPVQRLCEALSISMHTT
jgi:hypothetical protein